MHTSKISLKAGIAKSSQMHFVDWVLCVYLVTININVLPETYSALLQNAAYLLFLGSSLYFNNFKFRKPVYFLFYGMFLVYASASLLWTNTLSGSWTLLRILLKVFVVCVIMAGCYSTTEKIERALKAVYYALIFVVVFIVIVSPVSDWEAGLVGKEYGIDTVRFAVRASLCSVLGLYFHSTSKKKIHLVIAVLVLALSLVTSKRTGLMFFAIAAAVYYFIYQPNLNKRFKVVVGIIIIGLFFFYLIDTVPFLADTIGQRLQDFAKTFWEGKSTDASTIQREKIMEYAIKLFKQKPFCGNGLNSLRNYLSGVNFEHVTYAHNNYLEIAGGLGIVGCILYYLMYGYGVLRSSALLKKNRTKNVALYLALFIAFLVCDLMQVTYESYFEIMFLAILVTGVQNAAEETKTNDFH